MAEVNSIPSILIVSSGEKHPYELVKLITEQDNLPNCTTIEDGVDAFLWHISTKYYEADVNLCAVANKILLSQHLASTVEAIVLYFDSSKPESLQIIEGWLPFLKEYGAEVCILLCKKCEESPPIGVSKLKAQEWCMKEGYELVELEPDVDEEWETEQDFVETTGIKRVIQALHAHVWPNLNMRDRKEPTSFQNLLHGGGGISEEMADLRLGTQLPDMAECNIEDRIEELLGCGSQGDFSNLFSQLQTLKDRVSTLPHDQRKVCAEQVVLAFWKAIGGDEEEVELPEDQGSL